MEKTVEELVSELTGLKSDLKMILDSYTLSANAQVNRILEVLEQKDFAGEVHPIPSRERLRKMTDRVRKIKMKPEKGRLKDLVRIQKVLDELTEVVS